MLTVLITTAVLMVGGHETATDYLFQRGHYRRSLDLVAGVNWNQPVGIEETRPRLGNRFGLSYETMGLSMGKVGHLPVSVGLLYSTRAAGFTGDFDKATFTLIQAPLLGHGAIMGLPWLEACGGLTPGYVLDLIRGSQGKGYIVDNQSLKTHLNCDITLGLAVNLAVTQMRFLVYQSPVANSRWKEMTFSGFTLDWLFPLHLQRVP
jgi:hypothetical protein